jgi:hypothetical protein
MTPTILPMTLGDIFDRVTRLIGATFFRNLVIASIFLLPVTILLAFGMNSFFSGLAGISQPDFTNATEQFNIVLRVIAGASAFFFVLIIYGLGVTSATLGITAISCAEMSLEPFPWQSALQKIFSARLPRLIGQYILQLLAIGAVLFIPYAVIIGGIIIHSTAVIVIGVLFLFVGICAVCYLSISWSFTPQAIVWEDAGVIESLKRSWEIVRTHWWRIFGILILMGIIVGFATSIITAPIYFLAMWKFIVKNFETIGSASEDNPAERLGLLQSMGFGLGLMLGLSSFIKILIEPLYMTVLYFDLRARRGEFSEEIPDTSTTV